MRWNIIDYYAFEYSVLSRLQEIFAIKDVIINEDVCNARRTTRDDAGNLCDVTVGRFVVDNYI